MDKSKKSATKRIKSEDLNPLILTHLQKSCTENDVNVLLACYVLNADIIPGIPWSTYTQIIKYPPEEERINLYIGFENYEKMGVINKLYIKNSKISLPFLEILYLTISKHDTISSMKLDNCNLTASEIDLLHTILVDFQNITDLSVNENPNSHQNFSKLLENSNLAYLSLKGCRIDEYGIQNICDILENNNLLLSLNLTGNFIDDNGAIHIAKMLRQNRTLRTLNVTNNWITDVGCYDIMQALQTFPLTHIEIMIKRKINIQYYTHKAKLIAQFKTKFTTNVTKTSKQDIRGSKTTIEKQLSFYLDENLPPRTHPFTTDTGEKYNHVYCFGNFKLAYINLSYNNITSSGYKVIIDVLNYQLSNDYLGSGVTFIGLEGNNDLESSEFFEIYAILMEKKLKCTSYASSKTTILNNRSSSKYNSAVKIS